MPLLVDAGIWYALADRRDDWHTRARTLLLQNRHPPLTPITVVPEVSYLLAMRLGPAAEQAFVRSLVNNEITVEPVSSRDAARALALMESYPAIGFVDATVVAIAERLKLTVLATTDRRHFGGIRPRHAERFTLVP